MSGKGTEKVNSMDLLKELRENQKDVIKNQTDLMLGQGHIVDQLDSVKGKVELIDRSINKDNGMPCIQTRLRCTEESITAINAELLVVKAVKTEKKSTKKLIGEWITILCGVLIALKTLGLI